MNSCRRQRDFTRDFARYFGGPKTKPMTPPPDPPERTDKPVQEAEKERKQQKVAARGYSKSIATSPMGVTGEQSTGSAQKLG